MPSPEPVGTSRIGALIYNGMVIIMANMQAFFGDDFPTCRTPGEKLPGQVERPGSISTIRSCERVCALSREAPLPPVEWSCPDDGMRWLEEVLAAVPVDLREQCKENVGIKGRRIRTLGEVSSPSGADRGGSAPAPPVISCRPLLLANLWPPARGEHVHQLSLVGIVPSRLSFSSLCVHSKRCPRGVRPVDNIASRVAAQCRSLGDLALGHAWTLRRAQGEKSQPQVDTRWSAEGDDLTTLWGSRRPLTTSWGLWPSRRHGRAA